jgi:hypothetical protein
MLAGYQLASDAADARARRRAQVERISSVQNVAAVVYAASVVDGARLLLEAFERGEDQMMGYPRHLVDFDRAYRSLES